MRKAYEHRAENYIKKHQNYKKWLAFVLCVAIITGSITLYVLNKPAAAMTEEGAQSVGLVMETADDDFESGLIEEMNQEGDDSGDDTDDGSDESGNEEVEETTVEENATPDGENNSDDSIVENKDDSEEVKTEEAEKVEEADKENTADSAATNGTTVKEEEEAESVLASTASTEASDAASTASSEMSTEASTEASSIESIEDYKDVIVTVKYVDSHDKEIAESKELSITDSFDIKKDAKNFEGYFFNKAVIDDEEIVKVEKETKEFAASAKGEENKDSASLLTDVNGETVEHAIYKVTTADGEVRELEEDTELDLVYYPANTKTEFVYSDGDAKVKVVLTKPDVFPEGIELTVTEVERNTKGYNYDAYLAALNSKAGEIAGEGGEEDAAALEFDEKNTVLLDIAFLLDNVEYDLTDGTASVSIEYTNNKISADLDTDNSEDVTIVHLPLTDEVKEKFDSTSEATSISANDIQVEVFDDGKVDLGDSSDNVSFQTDSFCVFGVIKSANGRSWVGTKDYSANEIIDMLGDSTYFGVVANNYDGCNNHSEANVAVKNIKNIQDYTIGNSTQTYQKIGDYKITVNKVVNGAKKAGKFFFAVYQDAEGTRKIQGSDFSITTGADGKGSQTLDYKLLGQNSPRLYVFELDKEGGKPIKNNEKYGSYTVTYGANGFDGLNDSMALYTDNFVENIGGRTREQIGRLIQHIDGATIYYKKSGGAYGCVTYDHRASSGSQYLEYTFNGEFPVNIDNLLSKATNAASEIALAKSNGSVEVANVIATDGGNLCSDLTRYYFNKNEDNYAVNQGFSVGSKLLVINVDLTNVRSYTFNKIKVNGLGTGDWSEVANQIVLNPVVDKCSRYVPYEGKLNVDISSGALVAPKCTVECTGSYSGTIIANSVIKRCEIHKMVVRKHLSMMASTTITNTDATRVPVELKVGKLVDGKTPEAEDVFSFTLKKYDEKNKGWQTLSNDIHNDFDKISYTIEDPQSVGMEYGKGNVYYFMFTENDTTGTYIKDTSALLAKVEYEEGQGDAAIKGISYYKINADEANKLNTRFDKKYFKNEIKDNINFNNKKIQNFDLGLTKFLNGSPLQDNNLKFNFWVRLVKTDANGSRTVEGGDRRKYPASMSSITNNGSKIEYPVDAVAWGLEHGNTYYYVFGEGSADASNTTQTVLDKSIVVAKIDYYVDGENLNKTYYRITDKATAEAILASPDSCAGIVDQCNDSTAVPEDKAGFYNKSSVKLVLVKNWKQNSTNGIFDVTVKIKRHIEGGELEDYKDVVISASDCSDHGGKISSNEYVIDELETCDANGNKYEYVAEEYYNNGSELVRLNAVKTVAKDAAGNVISQSSEADEAVSSVNGYKLTDVTVTYDESGNVRVELTNDPYIKIRKSWTLNGVDVPYNGTKDFGTVFVNLYQSNGSGSPELVKGPIALSYGSEWTAEVPVPGLGRYYIVECDSTGAVEYRQAPKITYYAYNKDAQTMTSTEWSEVYGEGGSVTLVVANERSGNVLPNSGGIGEFPILAIGLGTALTAVLGGSAYNIRKKKDESEEKEES